MVQTLKNEILITKIKCVFSKKKTKKDSEVDQNYIGMGLMFGI
jgi:hypothetical protein